MKLIKFAWYGVPLFEIWFWVIEPPYEHWAEEMTAIRTTVGSAYSKLVAVIQ